MKLQRFFSLLLPLLLATAIGAEAAPHKRLSKSQASALVTNEYVDVNKLLLVIANNGAFAYDVGAFFGKNDGLYFPYTSVDDIISGANNTSVVFASGVWMGAVDSASGDTLIAVAEYSQEYFPGNMVGGTFDPAGLTNGAYRFYRLDSDSLAGNPNADYTAWPVSQGAPVDGSGNPKITGNEMQWCVYNDANPTSHSNDAGLTAPLGVEIQQSAFAFRREDALGNVVFLRHKIMNKGGKTLTNMYISLWSDPDLGGASDDLVGCDIDLSLGFCYNATNGDASYGSAPPAVGYDFLQGPLEFTGDNADTAKMFGQLLPGYRNLPMSSFNKYINGTDPHAYQETYNYMQGLNRDGTAYTTPSGDTTTFFNSGDPVAGTGDLDANPADRRYMLTTGPFTFRPGDSTEVYVAIIVGQGSDRLTSITALKYFDQFAQTAYDLDFELPEPPAQPQVTVSNLPNQVVLNWTNNSETNNGDFPFEGYTVFQGESPSGPWKRIQNYDLNNAVGIIFDDEFDLDDGVVVNKPVKFGNDGGLGRSLSITEDFINGGGLNNATDYFYRVEAYSYDPVQTPKTLTSATTVIATPQGPTAGNEPAFAFGDTLVVDTTGKTSDGSVVPMVLDPMGLNGHTYLVIFGTDSVLGPVWHLIDSTTGDTVLYNQTNQSGNNDYVPVDGMLVKVQGPPAGFKNFEVVANGSGALDPSEGGAFDFASFPSIRPTDRQQNGAGLFGIHTADNGGTVDGGTRGAYTAFLSRVLRDGGNNAILGSYDYEIRFTGTQSNPGVNGGYGWQAFGTGENSFWLPFELWRIGIGTPGDPSDDVRMIPHILDDGNALFDFSSWGSSGNGGGPNGFEHSASGADNDPYTDWIYWMLPTDLTPGEAGYNAVEALMMPNTYDGAFGTGDEVMARIVIMNWNGGSAPPFNQDMPEQGTIFRITTNKPNAPSDTFKFVATAPAFAASEQALDQIRAVPNPYYLFSSYDDNTYNRQLKFTNLPATCTITIYSLAGDVVTRIEKDDATSSEAFWNVETAGGIPVASGIYLYVVEADGFGQKVGKMAIFTEVEQLEQNY